MKSTPIIIAFILSLCFVSATHGQQNDAAARDRTREQLGQLLEKLGPKLNITFTRSAKQPYNFVGDLTTGLTNTEKLEVVVIVSAKLTIRLKVYPHYNKGYINVDKARDQPALMRTLLRLSDQGLLYWASDDEGDVFTGYTFTIESGFPSESIEIVLLNILNSDKAVGELKPFY